MDRLKRIIRKAVAVILTAAVFLAIFVPADISNATDTGGEPKALEEIKENDEAKENGEIKETGVVKKTGEVKETGETNETGEVKENAGDGESSKKEIDDETVGQNQNQTEKGENNEPIEELIEKESILGSGYYGTELNSQGYKVQVTSYIDGNVNSVFNEGILRFQDSYVFCYNPSKHFKETDNYTFHEAVPDEFTAEQGKTIALMIHYILSNYDIQGPNGAINYYLGQCAIWNYINMVNPGYNPYKIYITDATSIYTSEEQEEALAEILSWVEENKDNYNTYLQYWINEDGDYQPVLYGGAVPIEKGHIEIQKSSADVSAIDGNNNYSLEGAVYGIYTSNEDADAGTNQISSITVGRDGRGVSEDLSFATYYVKEITAPKGYTLDSTVYAVTIDSVNKFPTVSSLEKPVFGRIKVIKSSADSKLTSDNNNYSLAGATYGIYKSRNDAESDSARTTTILTGADGTGISDNLPIGTYYVKEVTASKGYTLDANIYEAKIIYANAVNNEIPAVVVSSVEKPRFDDGSLMLIKKDDESDDAYEKLYLEGAVFEIKYYAAESERDINDSTYKRHWYLKTDSDGKAYLKEEYLTTFENKDSNEFYRDNKNRPILPLGYITIQEVKAPNGYVLDEKIYVYKINPKMSLDERENQRTLVNKEKRQAFQIVKLAEDKTSDFKPLSNAGFMACKVSDLSFDEEGNYIFDEAKAVKLTADGSREMFTDEDGYALSAELRYGTYLVRETTVPIGYMPVADFYITISEDSRSPQKILYKTDKQTKYYLRITKLDSKTNQPVLNNSSTYKIWSYKDDDYVSFKTYTGSKYENVSEFKTDENGILITPGTLTYGDYRLIETVAPYGYNIDNPEGKDFSINDDTIYITTENLGDTVDIVDITYSDTPVTGNLSILKTGERRIYDEEKREFITDIKSLKDIEFGLYAAEDIYSPDGSKTKIYESGELVCTLLTDADGKAKKEDIPLGKYIVKELNTPEDFIQSDDMKIEFNAQEGKAKEDGIYTVDKEVEILNKAYYPEVKTTACDKKTGKQIGAPEEKTTIVDKVECTNLVVGRKYVVKGKLYDTSTGGTYHDADGKEVRSEHEFTASKKEETVSLEFTFNGLNLQGETITVFEELYHDGKKVAVHADISDTNQQVHYPAIGTTAKNAVDGGKVAAPEKKVTLNDTVDISNVDVGEDYIIHGVVYDKSTGEKLLVDGQEVWGHTEFTATDEHMKTDVVFTFDATELAGKSVVLYEYMYVADEKDAEVLVASHEDINYEGQTIKFSDEPKTGDKDFTWIIITMIVSLAGIAALRFKVRK